MIEAALLYYMVCIYVCVCTYMVSMCVSNIAYDVVLLLYNYVIIGMYVCAL